MEFIEFETKYEVQGDLLHPFKELIEEEIGYDKFLYVQGTDVFFTKENEEGFFARYRRADHSNEAQFTLKKKHTENSSIKRTETNWDVSGTSFTEVKVGAELMGFEYNSSIWKGCHIYNREDATLVFYSVRDESRKIAHFIEIEVKEGVGYSEEESWEIIKKYEKLLAPLGIIAQKRKQKSLFEMYRRK